VKVPGIPFWQLAVDPDGWLCAGSGAGIWLLDARPLTPELRQQHEARNLVAYLFRRPMLKPEVLAVLRELRTISEPVRQQALVLAQQQKHDYGLLNARSMRIVVHTDRTPEEYRKAVEWSVEAVRLMQEAVDEGNTAAVLNTLGWAQYRAGRYEEAVATLERSNSRIVFDQWILAMAYWQLGRHDEARAALQKARDPTTGARIAPRQLREAEALIEGKITEPKN
jgi:tetratricopeptide (TPR) repeat protein